MTKDKITNRLYFVILPLVLLLSTVILFYSANNSHQSREANKQLVVINGQLKTQVQSNASIVKEQDKHLQCILAFFGTQNRTSARISNFDPCTIVHNDTGQTEILPLLPEGNKSAVQPNSPAETQVQMRPAVVQSVTPTPNPSPTGSPTPVTTLPNCTVDVLFIHIGC